MRHLVATLIFLIAGTMPAAAVTIDFEEFSPVADLTSLTNKGFVFTPDQSGGGAAMDISSFNLSLQRLPDYFGADGNCAGITLEHGSGNGFSLESLDILAVGQQNYVGGISCVPGDSDYIGVFDRASEEGCPLTIIGTTMTGGSLEFRGGSIENGDDWEFTIDGYNFNQIILPDTWANLQSVRIEVGGNGYDIDESAFWIDNIVVSTVVPIPAAAYLFASGLGLLGWFRRKAQS